ncbi:MAG: hypothetical protein NVSMB1_12300 [Polyangiales bacterium]
MTGSSKGGDLLKSILGGRFTSTRLTASAAVLGSLTLGAFVLPTACSTPDPQPRYSCLHTDCGPSVSPDNDADKLPEEETSFFGDALAVGDGAVSEVQTPTDTPGCTVPMGKACGAFPQCGCASGQSCDFVVDDGSTKCVAAGSKKQNEPCDSAGQCQVGLSCFGGLCRPLCASDADCGSAPAVCKSVLGSSGKPVPGYNVCLVRCDPMSPKKSCGAVGCSFYLPDPACVPAGTGVGAGACSKDFLACSPGYNCYAGNCRRWCRLGFSTDCPTTKSCQAFSSPHLAGPVDNPYSYGLCTL